MANPTVTFNFESSEITVQCLKTETMRTIIQRFETKIQQSADSFMYLYGEGQVNMDLTFEQQANHLDRENNQMKILVYKTENNGIKFPYCGIQIKLSADLDDIIRAYNNLKETINDVKLMLENIIKTSVNNSMNNQLKIINISLDKINEDVRKNNQKLENILNNGGDSNNQKSRKILNNNNNINDQKVEKTQNKNNIKIKNQEKH